MYQHISLLSVFPNIYFNFCFPYRFPFFLSSFSSSPSSSSPPPLCLSPHSSFFGFVFSLKQPVCSGSEFSIKELCPDRPNVYLLCCCHQQLHRAASGPAMAPGSYFSFIFIIDTITDVPYFSPLLSPSSPWPLAHCCLCPWALPMCIYVLWQISASPPNLLPSEICQSVPCIHDFGFILFINLFCSLDFSFSMSLQ